MRFRRLESGRRNFSCRYLAYQKPNGDYIRLPLLKIEIESESEIVSTTALIDSGSNVTFIPREIADDILELPHVGEDEVRGAGSTFPCFISEAKRIVLKKGVHPIGEYINWRVYVPKPPVDVPYAILGRDTVFKNYQIIFRDYDERFVLRRR